MDWYGKHHQRRQRTQLKEPSPGARRLPARAPAVEPRAVKRKRKLWTAYWTWTKARPNWMNGDGQCPAGPRPAPAKINLIWKLARKTESANARNEAQPPARPTRKKEAGWRESEEKWKKEKNGARRTLRWTNKHRVRSDRQIYVCAIASCLIARLW